MSSFTPLIIQETLLRRAENNEDVGTGTHPVDGLVSHANRTPEMLNTLLN
jgi:hypothetical protein